MSSCQFGYFPSRFPSALGCSDKGAKVNKNATFAQLLGVKSYYTHNEFAWNERLSGRDLLCVCVGLGRTRRTA